MVLLCSISASTLCTDAGCRPRSDFDFAGLVPEACLPFWSENASARVGRPTTCSVGVQGILADPEHVSRSGHHSNNHGALSQYMHLGIPLCARSVTCLLAGLQKCCPKHSRMIVVTQGAQAITAMLYPLCMFMKPLTTHFHSKPFPAAQTPLTLGSLFILLRAVFCISANLTVNESIVGKKYPYLQSADRQYWNYFDRGTLANCLQFWLVGSQRPDWALIFQREQQVCKLCSIVFELSMLCFPQSVGAADGLKRARYGNIE